MKREDEPEEFAIAEMYFEELRTWLKYRDSAEPWTLSPGSEIAGDDEATRPFRVSHNIANSVVSAVDHLHSLDSLMIRAGASHTLAPFSIMRAAIETAAQGAWVAAPQDQNTRVLRGLRLSLKDFDDRSKAYKELNSQHPRLDGRLPNFADDKQLLQGILDKAGIHSKLTLPTSTAILQEVRDLVPGTSVLSVWQLCSGFAHGRQWASDAVLKPKSRVEIGDGVVAKENRPTMKLFVWTMTAAMDLTRYTIQRYMELASPERKT